MAKVTKMPKAAGTRKRRARRGDTLRAAQRRARDLKAALQEAQAKLAELEGLAQGAFKARMQATQEDLAALAELISGRTVRQDQEGNEYIVPVRNALARVKALELKFAYGYGRPVQPTTLGGDPTQPVRVVVEILEQDEAAE